MNTQKKFIKLRELSEDQTSVVYLKILQSFFNPNEWVSLCNQYSFASSLSFSFLFFLSSIDHQKKVISKKKTTKKFFFNKNHSTETQFGLLAFTFAFLRFFFCLFVFSFFFDLLLEGKISTLTARWKKNLQSLLSLQVTPTSERKN